MSKCTFCNRDSYTGNTIAPSMCVKHFDLVLVANRADSREESVSYAAIAREMSQLPHDIKVGLSFLLKEVPYLLRPMQEQGYIFYDSRRRLRIRKCAVANPQGETHANPH